MKRLLLLTTIGMFCVVLSQAQNVFNSNDSLVRYRSDSALGSLSRPNPATSGLQKWVATSINGISTGSNSYDTKSFKAYFMNAGTEVTQQIPFRLKYPKSFNNPDSAGKKYPIMIFFHGAGEGGCSSNNSVYNNELQLLHGGKIFRDWVDNGQFDGFLLYPQSIMTNTCSSTWGDPSGSPKVGIVVRIIDSLVKYTRVDNDRVFVDGLSDGGSAAWNMTYYYPTRVAKAAPSSATLNPLFNFNNLVHIPIWFATGGKDTNPSPGSASSNYQTLLNLGADIKYTLFPDLGHSVWYNHWAEPGFVDYMNDIHKANPLVFFQRFQYCPEATISAKMGITAGFYAYEWQKDNVTIATSTNGTNNIVVATNITSFTGNEITVNAYGTYRVRFKRSASADWSAWSRKPAVISQKSVTQTPPIKINGLYSNVLSAPDGNSTVSLKLPYGYDGYKWYKDGSLVSGATDSIYVAGIGTYKAQVVETNGCGTLFSPDFKVIDASGTPKPEPAKNLTATALSITTIQLNWTENPNASENETGYEIYRSTVAGGPYTLIYITAPDVTSYIDNSPASNTTYYYIVRAVGSSGAAANSNQVSIQTEKDTIPPTAPANFVLKGISTTYAYLQWDASSDNVGVARYNIYLNGAKTYTTTSTNFAVANLDSNKVYTFYVRAEDAAGNLSIPSAQVVAATNFTATGLNYKYYQGTWAVLPDFNTLPVVKSGTVTNLDLTVRVQDNYVGMVYDGFIKIPVSDTYTFSLCSDDGSKLFIGTPYSYDGTPLIDNDGGHSNTCKTGSVYLQAGFYPITVPYFNVTGSLALTLSWKNTTTITTSTAVPNANLFRSYNTGGSAPAAPSNLIATVNGYDKINLTWVSNSSNQTGFEVVRSTSATGSFVPVVTVTGTSYTDAGLTPGTTYYYKVRAIGTSGASDYSYSYKEVNWKVNNNGNDDNGNASRTLALTTAAYSTADVKEGTHSLNFTNSAYATINNSTSGFPQEGYYSQRTVALWLKPAATNNKRVVFDFGSNANGLGLRFNAGVLQAGVVANATANKLIISSPSLTNASSAWVSNAWNHVAVVYYQNSLKLFINGTQVASGTTSSFTNVGVPVASVARLGYSSGTAVGDNVFNETTSTSAGNTTSSDYYSGYMDDIHVINGALNGADLTALMNGTFAQSIATTQAAPAPPATPTGLSATALSTSSINLTWTDNATNETGYEIWRSSGSNTNYRKLVTLGAGNGQMSYEDDSLFANVTYYYKVIATGKPASSAASNEASATTQNTNPVITQIPNFSMKYGTTFTLPIKATDPDGDLLTFTYTNLPSFATTQNVSNGNAAISFTTTIRNQGVFTMKVYVADAFGGKDSATFSMSVNNNSVPVINNVADVTMNEGDSVYVALTGTDIESTSSMTWSATEIPVFASLVDKGNGLAGVILKPGYTQSGTYAATVRVNDGYGAWIEKSFNVKVNDKDPNETIQLNMMYYTGNVPLWNDLDFKTQSSFPNLKNIKGETTTVGFNTVGYNTPWYPGDGGAQTGNNTGVYPDNIMKDRLLWGFFNGSNYDSIRVRVSGLNPAGRYNLTFFGSYVCAWCGMSANSVTTYKIGAQSTAVHFSNNTQETGTIYQVQPNTNGEIFIDMIGDTGDPNSGGVLNALVISTVYDDGNTPAKPTNLAAGTLTGGIKLTWNDNSLTEEAYRVYRATNATGPFTLLNPTANNKDSVSYNDMTVTSYTQYYYYVVGVNHYGTGVSSDTVGIKSSNNNPVISSISNISIKSNVTGQSDFTITDDPGDIISVTIPGKPYFINVVSLGGSNYRLQVNPAVGDVGTYNLVINAADDKGGSATRNVTVVVSDKNTRSLYINFAADASQIAPAPWNNYLIFSGATPINNLVDENNATTSMSMTWGSAWTGYNLNQGFITGNNSGVFPDIVLATGVMNGGTDTKTITFNGLDNAKKYNLVFVGSRNEGVDASTKFICGSISDTLNGSYNSNQTANLNGLTPTSGSLTVSIVKLSSAAYALINAIQIEEYTTTSPLNPSNLYVEPLTRNKIKLSWSDRTNNENATDGFQLQRATDSLFSTGVTNKSLAANTTVFTDSASILPNTKYWYRVRAKVGTSTYSDWSNIEATITPQSIVYINFNYSTGSAAFPWNNWESFPVYYNTFTDLTDQGGNPSGLSLSIVKTMNGDNNYGVVTGNNSGIVPDGVLQTNYWIDRTQLAQMKLSGLSLNKRYRVGFIGSMSTNGWFYGNYTGKYIVNGRTVYLNSWNNSTKIVYIGDLTSDQNGEMMLNFTTTEDAAWAFNAGLIVEAYDDKVSGAGTVVNGTPDSLTETSTTVDNIASANTEIVRTRVYPNPFTDIINLDFNNSLGSNVISVNMYDLNGRLVLRQNFGRLPEGANTLRVNTSSANLPTGLYTMTLHVNGSIVQVSKVVKSRQ